jgi:DNA polymerase III epsilon subunit-like protein
MPISAESQRVTGIADADVAGVAPRWEVVAAQWRKFLEGCVLHGYNARRFDVPVLR